MFNFSIRGIDFDLEPDAVSAEPAICCTSEVIRLPLCRSRGDQMQLLAQPGQMLRRHQPIAVPESEGCAVTCPFDAVFESLARVRLPMIGRVPCALLRAVDGARPEPQEPVDDTDLDSLTPEQIIQRAFNASLVDSLDGRFLYEKLSRAKQAGAAVLVADAVDDQPGAALGTLLLRHYKEELRQGVLLAARAVGAKTAGIALFGNGIAQQQDYGLTPLYAGHKYPAKIQTAKKISTMGGGLLIGAAAAVHLYRAVAQLRPQTTQFFSVAADTGKIRLAEAYLGARIDETLSSCRLSEKGFVVAGGLMTGEEIGLDSVVWGGLQSLCVIRKLELPIPSPCISCGACNRTCPEHLLPSYINRALEKGDLREAEKLKIHRCTGCGCCSYVCPAGLPVAQNMQVGQELCAKSHEKAG